MSTTIPASWRLAAMASWCLNVKHATVPGAYYADWGLLSERVAGTAWKPTVGDTWPETMQGPVGFTAFMCLAAKVDTEDSLQERNSEEDPRPRSVLIREIVKESILADCGFVRNPNKGNTALHLAVAANNADYYRLIAEARSSRQERNICLLKDIVYLLVNFIYDHPAEFEYLGVSELKEAMDQPGKLNIFKCTIKFILYKLRLRGERELGGGGTGGG